MRHAHGRLFMAAGNELRLLIAAVIDDRFVQGAESIARLGADVFKVEGLEDVHHEVGTGTIDRQDLRAGRVTLKIWPQVRAAPCR